MQAIEEMTVLRLSELVKSYGRKIWCYLLAALAVAAAPAAGGAAAEKLVDVINASAGDKKSIRTLIDFFTSFKSQRIFNFKLSFWSWN